MKRLSTTLVTLLLWLCSFSQITYNIKPSGDGGVFIGNASGYKPGDKIVLKGNYNYFYFSGAKGDSLHPITIVMDSLVTFSAGFDFKDCKWIKVDGGPNKNLVIDQKSVSVARVAISIHGYSEHIEFANFIVRNSGYGSWCKNEHDDLLDTAVSHHVLNDICFHDFEMYNLFSHGFYWGATEYPNKTRPVTINGVAYYPNPSMLGNIKIYNGKIRNVGRNGVMLCLAQYGKNEIYNMDIDTTGRERNQDQQGSGIQLGGFTSAYVHDNKVNHTLLWGIRSFGGSNLRIENNTISNSGNSTDTIIKWAQNIAVGPDNAFVASGIPIYLSIKSNQCSAPGSDLVSNIQLWKGGSTFIDTSVVCNNTGTVKADAGIVYKTTCTTTPVVTTTPPPITTTQTPATTVVLKQVDKGYYKDPDTLKTQYWVMYKDQAGNLVVKKANAKYQPL